MELQPYATNAVDNDDAGGKADPEEYDNAYLGPGDAAPASPAALPPVLDVSSRLNELEAVLRQPDSVMEPTILDSLREYVLSQGQPQQAVEFLTESYVGYAQMASLACSWLKLVDDRTGNEALDATTPEQAMPPISSAAAGSNPPSHSVMQPPREGSPAEGPVVRARTPGATPLAEMDEAYFLRSLAFERYDPQKFANIFSAGGSGAPKWLNALIDDPG